MHERPQAALFKALRELGYHVDSPNDKLPATIVGSSRRESAQTSSGRNQSRLTSAATVSIGESSQFASALLLCAQYGGWEVKVVGENAEESPYVAMTSKMIETFPKSGGKFQIEPDASSGSYFWAAGTLERGGQIQQAGAVPCRLTVTVSSWPNSAWQIDQNFPWVMFGLALNSPSSGSPAFDEIIMRFGSDWAKRQDAVVALLEDTVPLNVSRRTGLGDSVMTAITMAPLSCGKSIFTDLGRLRVQECERVVALRTELTKCGAKVVEEGDTLTVYPSTLHGAEVETYNDHRMAMCFAILGLKVPGIKIKNPACVKKTFPNFFQKLAAPPPNGLGATILDAKTGRKLELKELFAE
jgi:3-phosphoshikimate 1-carboxyvinyltransferase